MAILAQLYLLLQAWILRRQESAPNQEELEIRHMSFAGYAYRDPKANALEMIRRLEYTKARDKARLRRAKARLQRVRREELFAWSITMSMLIIGIGVDIVLTSLLWNSGTHTYQSKEDS